MQTKFTHLLLITLLSLPAAAAVNKCIGPDGKVTYSAIPCAPDSKSSQQLRIVDNAIVDGQAIKAEDKQRRAQTATKQANATSERQAELERMRVEACRKMMEEPKKMGDFTRAYKACQALSGQKAELEQPVHMPMKAPITITNCNDMGCYDNRGQFYAKSGNVYVGPNGCRIFGGVLSCP